MPEGLIRKGGRVKGTRELILKQDQVSIIEESGQAVGTVWTVMGDPDSVIAQIYKDVIAPNYIQGSLGLQDDPIDEIIVVALIYKEIDEDISAVGWQQISSRAIWVWEQNWRAVGVDAGPTQVLDNVYDILDRRSDQIIDKIPPFKTVLQLVARSSTASTVRCNIKVGYNVLMEQRRFADDPSEWAGYTSEEAGMQI